jgi:hypothetical protein
MNVNNSPEKETSSKSVMADIPLSHAEELSLRDTTDHSNARQAYENKCFAGGKVELRESIIDRDSYEASLGQKTMITARAARIRAKKPELWSLSEMFEIARSNPELMDGYQFENRIRDELRSVNTTVINKLDKNIRNIFEIEKKMTAVE